MITAVSLSKAILTNNELADMVCKSVLENDACALPTDVLTGLLGPTPNTSTTTKSVSTTTTNAPVPASTTTTNAPIAASTTTTKPKNDDTWLLLLALGIALAVFMKMRSGQGRKKIVL